ncbi:MAG: hypothetical protein ACJA2O_002689 [Candidatus Azotimanducaceae bacterium]|jgi:hypothetical protein
MQTVNSEGRKLISGGTSDIEVYIRPRFRQLIDAIEEFASLPKELIAHREKR